MVKSAIFIAVVIFATVAYILVLELTLPDSPFRDAVMVRICRDGTSVLRDTQGRLWALHGYGQAWRVEDAETVCR